MFQLEKMKFCSTSFTRVFSFSLYSLFPYIEQNIRMFLTCFTDPHCIRFIFGDSQSNEIFFQTARGNVLVWSIPTQSIHMLSLENSFKLFSLHISFHYPKLYCFFFDKCSKETSTQFRRHLVYLYDVQTKEVRKFEIEFSQYMCLSSHHLICICPTYLLIGSGLYSIEWNENPLNDVGKITVSFRCFLNVNCWFFYWINFYYHIDKQWYIIYTSYYKNQGDWIFIRCHDNWTYKTTLQTKSEDKSSHTILTCLDQKIVFATRFAKKKHFCVYSYLLK